MSDTDCCILIHIQVSQETGKVVCYSHLFKNFHSLLWKVKGFSVSNEAEVDIFLEIPWILNYQSDGGNLTSGSSAFLKPSLYIWNFSVHILLKPSLKDFEHNLAIMWNKCNCKEVWTFFGIALLWDWNFKRARILKNQPDFFDSVEKDQSLGRLARACRKCYPRGRRRRIIDQCDMRTWWKGLVLKQEVHILFLEKGRRCVDVEKFNGSSNGSINISHDHKNNSKQF